MASSDLTSRLAGIAREFQSTENPTEATHEIVAAARDLLDPTVSAAITLVHARERVETVSATDEIATEGDRLQYELRQGPCLDAAWEEEQVYAGDLAADDRWTTWAPRVAETLGVKSMLCTQLFTNEGQLGALNIYSTERYAFSVDDRETIRLLAAHAAVAVAAAQEIETLKVAIDRRSDIGKAIGITMAQYRIDSDRAFQLLTRLSSHQNRKLYDVAAELVAEATESYADPSAEV